MTNQDRAKATLGVYVDGELLVSESVPGVADWTGESPRPVPDGWMCLMVCLPDWIWRYLPI